MIHIFNPSASEIDRGISEFSTSLVYRTTSRRAPPVSELGKWDGSGVQHGVSLMTWAWSLQTTFTAVMKHHDQTTSLGLWCQRHESMTAGTQAWLLKQQPWAKSREQALKVLVFSKHQSPLWRTSSSKATCSETYPNSITKQGLCIGKSEPIYRVRGGKNQLKIVLWPIYRCSRTCTDVHTSHKHYI